MKKKGLFFLICVSIIIVSSCGKADFFSETKTVDSRVWKKNQKFTFEVKVDDTISKHDFYIDFRNNEDYPFSDIYFFFDIDFPNGKNAHDTIHYIMQDLQGKWLGNNSGSIIDNHVWIKPNVIFPLKGNYKMHLSQAMRMEELPGIEDVGITITRKEKNNK